MQEIKYRFFTNAPESYDYNYVETIRFVQGDNPQGIGGSNWRLIEVTDLSRFNNFQRPRYGSGLYQVHTLDSDEAKRLRLS